MGAEIQRPFFTEQFVKVAYLEYGAYIIFLSIKSKVESRKKVASSKCQVASNK